MFHIFKRSVVTVTLVVLLAGLCACSAPSSAVPSETGPDLSWTEHSSVYQEGFAYLYYPFFNKGDLPVRAEYCAYPEKAEGEYISCPELKEELPVYDLKEAAAAAAGPKYNENGQEVAYEETRFAKILERMTASEPVPSVYQLECEYTALSADGTYRLEVQDLGSETYLLGVAALTDAGEYQARALVSTLVVEEEIPYDLSWLQHPQTYTGDYSYTRYALFGKEAPVRRSACEVIREESVEGYAGAWVGCEELKKEQTVYDLKEAAATLAGQTFAVSRDGYRTQETVIYEDSTFARILQEAKTIEAIPGIYALEGSESYSLKAEKAALGYTLTYRELEDGAYYLRLSMTRNSPYFRGHYDTAEAAAIAYTK